MESIVGKTGHLISVHLPFVWYKPWRYLSLGIQKFTGSKWGHSAALIEIWDEWYAIEMNPKPQLVRWDIYRKGKIIKVSGCVYNYNEKNLAQTLMSKQDDSTTKYGYLDLFLWHPIYLITGHWLGRKEGADSRPVCSEYIAWSYNMVLGIFPHFYKTTPKNLSESQHFNTIYEGPGEKLIIIQL